MAIFASFILLALVHLVAAFPTYDSIAVYEYVARNGVAAIPNSHLPLPKGQDGLKLVNHPAHPFITASPNDIRGPCPTLNTIASSSFLAHYLPRNGVVRPDQIVIAVMEGLKLGNDFAKFSCYQALLMNGNSLTNLMSIGMKSPLTGPDTPKPTLVGGLTQHGTFQGDTSMTRVDAFFGDQAVLNKDLFQGSASTAQLHNGRSLVPEIFNKHPFVPGVNHGKNNFVWQPQTPPLSSFCRIYEDTVMRVIPGQYPKLTSVLRDALNRNLGFFYGAVRAEHNCTQVFPYGRD
ncbi:hypothetical protein M422DRAFT_264372 [Sphaerobolus stellatus SS14]|uniref:Heme haloperoxidase family profile domain-containing protein n=1 Tax=Sphaerobolus stellatus (strain SS14) TaxID=990650 RepID=A0A0C9V8G2_SPHS4|nr:hypothetical protein M422DRAFT_264372 [Sphaerobolus stellatus SS14]